MIKVSEKDIGKKVVYIALAKRDIGVITSFNDKLVFVKYGDKKTSEGTHPDNL